MRWIKWYGIEWINSTARDELSPAERGTFVDFVSLASFPGTPEGKFKFTSWEALARKLNTPIGTIHSTRDKCIDSNRITVDGDKEGIWVTIVNWEKYQTLIPRRKSKEGDAGAGLDKEVGGVCKIYEANIGLLTPVIAEELKDIAATYPEGWFAAAVEEACRQNKRNLSYIKAILARWQQEGFQTTKPKPRRDKKTDYFDGKYGHIVKH